MNITGFPSPDETQERLPVDTHAPDLDRYLGRTASGTPSPSRVWRVGSRPRIVASSSPSSRPVRSRPPKCATG